MRKRRSRFTEALAALDSKARARLAIAGGGLLLAVTLFATCGACGTHSRRPPLAPVTLPDGAVVEAEIATVDAASERDPLLWQHAKEGEEEDWAALAVHEGAAGLVEAVADPTLRPTALRAMAYARGWTQLPTLARAVGSKDDDEARTALASTLELAIRPRSAEDPEDVEELQEGCKLLVTLARDVKAAKPRRIGTIRALRMLPCPPLKEGESLPADVDTK